MAQYWARKDDQNEELRTIKPWEEAISNGDKVWLPKKEDEEVQASQAVR